MKYRPEIDGLRALAVVPVVLFHAGIKLFSGGFVGVDVFFVISGYLITTILIEDIENNRFSIIHFYERRARRILPALFLVILSCIPFAWIWMTPHQMKLFSQSLVAVSLFASNILFWLKTGYFGGIAEETPLLHTWSLAVEEQYYMLFPIFLFLTWRFGKNTVFWLVVIFALISLALSELGLRIDAIANFYLAPTRFWELFAGAISAFIAQKHGIRANNTFSLLGLAAIIFSFFAYDKNTPFPSIYTLVPVLGTVLLILFAEKKTSVAKLLSTKVFIWVGLISYSIYLWHQPLFAFVRIRSIDQPNEYLMLGVGLLSIFFAALSWKYVEKPFRKGTSLLSITCFGLIFSSALIIFGLVGHYTYGYDHRNFFKNLPDDFFKYAYIDIPILKGVQGRKCIDSNTPCTLFDNGKKNMLLAGDSHSVDYQSPLLNYAMKSNISLDQFSIAGCAFLEVEKTLFKNNPCGKAQEELLSIARSGKYDTIIIVIGMYNHANTKIKSYREYDSFSELVHQIAKLSHRVSLFLPRYSFNKPPLKTIVYDGDYTSLTVNLDFPIKQVDHLYSELSLLPNVDVFNQRDTLVSFSGKSLDNFKGLSKDGYPLYRDSNHITKFANVRVLNEFFKQKNK